MAIRIDRVATRGGDGGETSLGDGTRVAKDDKRIEAMGAVDDANAVLGRLRATLGDRPESAFVATIQNDLFDLGAGLCQPGAVGRLPEAATAILEAWIAERALVLEPLTSFILPGGSPAAADAHLARTSVRRAERRVVALGPGVGVDLASCRYLNRLSDALFMLGRVLNDNGRTDALWRPARSA